MRRRRRWGSEDGSALLQGAVYESFVEAEALVCEQLIFTKKGRLLFCLLRGIIISSWPLTLLRFSFRHTEPSCDCLRKS